MIERQGGEPLPDFTFNPTGAWSDEEEEDDTNTHQPTLGGEEEEIDTDFNDLMVENIRDVNQTRDIVDLLSKKHGGCSTTILNMMDDDSDSDDDKSTVLGSLTDKKKVHFNDTVLGSIE